MCFNFWQCRLKCGPKLTGAMYMHVYIISEEKLKRCSPRGVLDTTLLGKDI